ncbi:hypothetical protein GCK72_012999 [Caenorhabditis remanei]|uniref:Uncharacterized protein n=1 Tax=Caenorhabditis remanei TaxID=31234 RepID=A0A6A5GPU3_CAERE|nr:hypothetical protein GCK72_012999 [Caenorhabditis remanei]KAF1756546.1 hypothetical protein GCK72_012999 [Caenorhabditis remanei]
MAENGYIRNIGGSTWNVFEWNAFFCFQDHLTSYIYILLGIFVITAYVPTRQDFFERKIVGKFDVVGCSHQWWHIFILGAMIYWQQSGNQLLTEYRSFSDSCHRFIPQQNFSEISHSISNYSHPSM